MKKTFIGFCLALLAAPMLGQNRNSFAIIVDSSSYDKCKIEIENYCKSVNNDGLKAFIVSENWKSPEEIKDTIITLHKECKLEGVVFVGDIPIPMIRGAHHLTSAFKMDEDKFPMRDSSVPSDRFYDDFDLKFRFLGRDSSQSNLFYYELAPESPQYIECDIYSARIKPSSAYNDKYAELAAYLNKAVRTKETDNELDQITSYTGHGSFSNSLIAWKDETVTLSEQIPAAFSDRKEAKFLIFAMDPFMKETLIKEIYRPDLDLILFHEHGTTERQYITGFPESNMRDSYYKMGKFYARSTVRNSVRYGKTKEEAMKDFADRYGTDPSWYEDAFDPEVIKADSLFDLKTGIILDDIDKASPNVKMAIFDACYNGDFREDDWIANRYIMSDGNCLVAIGNSVNVLQDKSSSDLMGMLSCGYRIGEWMMNVNILESHIFGDPTYRFKSSFKTDKPDIKNTDCRYWLKYLNGNYPCDIQALALHKLDALGYKGISDLLLETYRTSPYYMTRLQCIHLLAHYNDGNYVKLLREALDDPYEFIRRLACTYIGKNGSEELLEDLVNAYLNDVNSKRIAFDIGFAAGHFPDGEFVKAMNKAIEESDFIADKEAFSKDAEKIYASPVSMAKSTEEILDSDEKSDSEKAIYISGMRNNPYPYMAEKLIGIVKSSENPLSLRVQAAEALGWFTRAWNKEMIFDELTDYLSSGPDIPEKLSDEITKTLNRLNCFLK